MSSTGDFKSWLDEPRDSIRNSKDYKEYFDMLTRLEQLKSRLYNAPNHNKVEEMEFLRILNIVYDLTDVQKNEYKQKIDKIRSDRIALIETIKNSIKLLIDAIVETNYIKRFYLSYYVEKDDYKIYSQVTMDDATKEKKEKIKYSFF
jgi:hypothetical protein